MRRAEHGLRFRVAQIGGFAPPFRSHCGIPLDAERIMIDVAEPRHRVTTSGVRCLDAVFPRLGVVLRHAASDQMHPADHVGGFGIAPIGGAFVPLGGDGMILGHTPTFEIEQGNIAHGCDLSQFSGAGNEHGAVG